MLTYRNGFIGLLAMLLAGAGVVGASTGVFADLNIAGTGPIAGAWTQVTLSTSVSAGGAGTLSNVTATLRYKKVARVVVGYIQVNVTNVGTMTSGYIQVAGLPFTPHDYCIADGRDAVTGIVVGIDFPPGTTSGLLAFGNNNQPDATNGNVAAMSLVCESTL